MMESNNEDCLLLCGSCRSLLQLSEAIILWDDREPALSRVNAARQPERMKYYFKFLFSVSLIEKAFFFLFVVKYHSRTATRSIKDTYLLLVVSID